MAGIGKVLKLALFSVLGLIGLFVVVAVVANISTRLPKPKTASTVPVSPTETAIRAAFKETRATNIIVGLDTLSTNPVSIRLRLQYDLPEANTNFVLLDELIEGGMKIIRSVSAAPEFSNAASFLLLPRTMMTDKFGNQGWVEAAKINLSRETVQQIKWDNMYSTRFRELVETEGNLWLHPTWER